MPQAPVLFAPEYFLQQAADLGCRVIPDFGLLVADGGKDAAQRPLSYITRKIGVYLVLGQGQFVIGVNTVFQTSGAPTLASDF